jgi:hypothetical protein
MGRNAGFISPSRLGWRQYQFAGFSSLRALGLPCAMVGFALLNKAKQILN